MSKKTTILDALHDDIRDSAILIEPDVHSDRNEDLINAIFDTTQLDSNTLQTYTTKSPIAGLTYDLVLRQNGGLINAQLTVKNTTAGYRSNESIFTWKTNDFIPESITKKVQAPCQENLAYEGQISISDAGVAIVGSFIANGTYIFNFTYNQKY